MVGIKPLSQCINDLTVERNNLHNQLQIDKSSIVNIKSRPIPDQLKAADLPSGIDLAIRNYIVETYNTLKNAGQLGLLDQPVESIYNYKGSTNFEAHPAIQNIANRMFREVFQYHYGAVLEYTKELRRGNLADLERYVVNSRVEYTQSSINFIEQRIAELKKTEENIHALSGKTAKDFVAGDFSFVPSEWDRKTLNNAYDAITKANAWSAFNSIPENISGYEFLEVCGKNGLTAAMTDMDNLDGHSGASMMLTMRQMFLLNKSGWESYVQQCLDHYRNNSVS